MAKLEKHDFRRIVNIIIKQINTSQGNYYFNILLKNKLKNIKILIMILR